MIPLNRGKIACLVRQRIQKTLIFLQYHIHALVVFISQDYRNVPTNWANFFMRKVMVHSAAGHRKPADLFFGYPAALSMENFGGLWYPVKKKFGGYRHDRCTAAKGGKGVCGVLGGARRRETGDGPFLDRPAPKCVRRGGPQQVYLV